MILLLERENNYEKSFIRFYVSCCSTIFSSMFWFKLPEHGWRISFNGYVFIHRDGVLNLQDISIVEGKRYSGNAGYLKKTRIEFLVFFCYEWKFLEKSVMELLACVQ